MSNMTYRDIPVIRSAGFTPSASGYTWFGTDIHGNEWQVSEDEDTSNLLMFRRLYGPSTRMTRETFESLFNHDS